MAALHRHPSRRRYGHQQFILAAGAGVESCHCRHGKCQYRHHPHHRQWPPWPWPRVRTRNRRWKICALPNCATELVGTYKTAYDLYSFTLTLNGAVLQAEADVDDGTLPLSHYRQQSRSVWSFQSIPCAACNHNKVRFIRDPESGAVAYVSADRYLYRRV